MKKERKKTTEDMTMYGFALFCKTSRTTISNRVESGDLILNDKGLVPQGTAVIEIKNPGRPKKYNFH